MSRARSAPVSNDAALIARIAGSIAAHTADDTALFVEIADAIAAEIRRGTLRAGDRLPSTRTLARDLEVNRNTVVAAFHELVAQGWLETNGARGTRISPGLPPPTPIDAIDALASYEKGVRPHFSAASKKWVRPQFSAASEKGVGPHFSATSKKGVRPHFSDVRPADAPGFVLREVAVATTPFGTEPAEFHVSIGVPDTRLVPHELLARAYRRALASRGGRAGLDYGSAHGTTRLREAVAVYLRGRGLAVGVDNVMITRGSQMAIDLAARAVLRPGDVAAVEELGYQPAWRALQEAGANLIGVPVDDAGLVADGWANTNTTGGRSTLRATSRARANASETTARVLYTTPHHQYPTTVLMSPARRLALLAHARDTGMAIIEDDYDHEFHFEGRPVPPLAAMDPTNVIYVGTLSKIVAPGLRLGFVAAHPSVIDRLARLRAVVDRQGDHVLESAIAELIEDGDIARHARKMRRVYAERRDALASALERELGGVLTFELPAGGMTLWARVAEGIDLDRWKQRAMERGVAVAFAKDFALDGKARPFVRLGFAHLAPKELADVARRLRAAVPGRHR